jgi:hypothetical protein
MKVRILKVELDELVQAQIIEKGKYKLPSLHEGWRFNFPKQAKERGTHAYVLVTEETPDIIEGCLLYKMKAETEPYMSYIETAPYNRGADKKYDLVAGCLIAFACRLSFKLGRGDYKGWLAFDVMEESKQDEKRLMAIYSKDYYAFNISGTTMMIIEPKDGEKLIAKYLGAYSN